MTATDALGREERHWTTSVVYCDEPSDPANPGFLPISTPLEHATMQNADTAKENRNRHSYHGDGTR